MEFGVKTDSDQHPNGGDNFFFGEIRKPRFFKNNKSTQVISFSQQGILGSSPRRQVTHDGHKGYVISKFVHSRSSSLPHATPAVTMHQPRQHSFPRPFNSLFHNQPSQGPNKKEPPTFSSFGSMQKKIGLAKPHPDLDQGWTLVNRKKISNRMDSKLLRYPFPADYKDPKEPRRCFNCGDDRHSVRFCPKGAFICFKCHEEGHIAKNCRSHLRPLEKKIDLSELDTLCKNAKVLAAFAILTVSEGNPSLDMIKIKLSWLFRWQSWKGKVIPIQDNHYLVEFPSMFQMSEAIDEKILDFESFKGWFAPWTENMGMKIVNSSFFQWIKLKNLPFHFWSLDIIEKIISSFGEMVRGCKNLKDKINGQDVRVLVKVKSAECIPKSIVCSYTSQIDSFTREVILDIQPIGVGQVGSEVIGNITAMEMQGEVVIDSQWLDQVTPQEEAIIKSPAKSSSEKAQVQISSSDQITKKGKAVISQNLNNELNAEDFQGENPLPKQQAFQISPVLEKTNQADSQAISSDASSKSFSESLKDFPIDLVKHSWKGQTVYMEKETWDKIFGGNLAKSNSNLSESAIPQASYDTPAIQLSTSAPPGFSQKQAVSTSVRTSRRPIISRKHRGFLKHISTSKSGSKATKKGTKRPSSSSSSVQMPLNSMSDNVIEEIAVNCGINLNEDSIAILKGKEVVRTTSGC